MKSQRKKNGQIRGKEFCQFVVFPLNSVNRDDSDDEDDRHHKNESHSH